jgi:hypothetical protein
MIRAPRDPGFYSRRYQIFWEAMDMKRGPFSLVRIIKDLLEWNVAASVQKLRLIAVETPRADHAAPVIRKSWH